MPGEVHQREANASERRYINIARTLADGELLRLQREARTGDRSRLDGEPDEPLDDVVRRFESRVALL